jgi:predicted dehydrogenase
LINRVLIVGTGSMGRRHLHLARRFLPDSEIKILARSTGNEISAFADGEYTSIDKALEFSPDLAVIASPATTHLDSAIPLAKLGAHLLIEKPIAASPNRVNELIEAVRKNSKIMLVGYNLRFSPSLIQFRKLIQSGLIGKIYFIRAEVGQYLPSWRPDADYRDSVSAKKELGGGVLLELSHELDYLRWIFGDIVSVYASLSQQSSLEIDVEDTAEMILNFESRDNGPSIVCSLHLDFVRQDSMRICTVTGEKGTLRWNALEGRIDHFESDTLEWKTVIQDKLERDATYVTQWQHLLECIATGHAPSVGGEDGLATIKVVEMARQSSLTGTRVTK